MRKCGKTPSFIILEHNFIGITLPADYCAEHEWGVSPLKINFGIPCPSETEKPFGLERRKSTKIPNNFSFMEENGNLYYFMKRYDFCKDIPRELFISTSFNKKKKIEIGGAWDENTFGIVVKKSNGKFCEYLNKIKEAVESNDIAIFFGGGGPFENPGLNIAIASKIPKDVIEVWEKADEENAKLYEDAENTGIKKKLKEGNKQFYALSPSRRTDFIKKQTKYNVIFWLNPMDQRKYEAGWYSVEELEQWIEEKGPVTTPGVWGKKK